MFQHYLGEALLVSPVPDDPDQWTVLWTNRGVLETLPIGQPTWTGHLDPESLTGALVHALTQTDTARRQALTLARRRQDTIEEIRQYAIDKHKDGAFCRDGLNQALEHFGLQPYQPRYQVSVTVTATVEISADDADKAESRVRYLLDGLAWSGEEPEDDLVNIDADISIDTVDQA